MICIFFALFVDSLLFRNLSSFSLSWSLWKRIFW